MMLQEILLLIIFSGALFYVGRLVYRSFTAKTGCASGCGKCGAIDFAKMERQIRERKI